MTNRKGFPYREKKKSKTTVVEDHRPHVAVRMPLRGWVQKKELEEETGSTNFHIPNLKYINDCGQHNWNRQDAHTLIDWYAKIAWKDKPEFRGRMNKLAGHFLSLWKRNKGLCAITKIPLLGGPSMLGYGIGIDLLHKGRGPVKGNIRLVSCPLAITRYRYPQHRTQEVELPHVQKYTTTINPKKQRTKPYDVIGEPKYHDVSYAIAQHFYWHMNKKKPFKNLPVSVLFPHVNKEGTLRGLAEPHGLIDFHWTCGKPKNNTWDEIEIGPSRFFIVRLDGDIIHLEGTDKLCDRKFSIADPSIDFFNEITKEVKKCFSEGMHIALRNLANYRGCGYSGGPFGQYGVKYKR